MASECRKPYFQVTQFKNFLGEDVPWPTSSGPQSRAPFSKILYSPQRAQRTVVPCQHMTRRKDLLFDTVSTPGIHFNYSVSSFDVAPTCTFLTFFFSLLLQMAFKYLSWALFPLLVCYAVYSLIYVEHKGWYSWILSMLYGFLLTFGEFMWNAITTPFS